MTISSNYVVVKKAKQLDRTGEFAAVEVSDDFVYKGQVVALPGNPVHVSNEEVKIGDEVMFAKYSPDTFEMDGKDTDPSLSEKVKFVKLTDILAITKTNA